MTQNHLYQFIWINHHPDNNVRTQEAFKNNVKKDLNSFIFEDLYIQKQILHIMKL